MFNKLKKGISENWLLAVKVGVVLVMIGASWPLVREAVKFSELKGKALGKVEMASVEIISNQYRLDWVRDSVKEFTKNPEYPNRDYKPYQWPAQDIAEFSRYWHRSEEVAKMLEKVEMEGLYSSSEDLLWYDARDKKVKLDALVSEYTTLAVAKFGQEAVSKVLNPAPQPASVIDGTKPEFLAAYFPSTKDAVSYSTLVSMEIWPLIQWGLISFFAVMFYSICKLKKNGYKVWCEVLNSRIIRKSLPLYNIITLTADRYANELNDQLVTVRRTCSTVLSLVITFGAAAVANGQVSPNSGSSTKQKTDYALIVESRESIAITGDDPKVENAVRVLFTTPNGIFLEDSASLRKERVTNTFIVGKWFDAPWFAKFGKLRIGPYGGWRFTNAPKASREDSVVTGAKISFARPLTKDKNVALNVVAPTLQLERSVQKKTFTFANATQVFGSWKKQGINIGAEWQYRKTQGRGFTGYVGPIFAKKLVSGKNFVKALFGEVGLFKEIPVGDLRFRLRFTLQL